MASTEIIGNKTANTPATTKLEFSTGSNYDGEVHEDRMQGKGEFLFPTGTRYEGEFNDGAFHGAGTLYFKDRGRFQAEWCNGSPQGEGIGGEYIYSDGLVHQQHKWDYCQPIDRRFYTELCRGLKPADRTQLVDKEEAPKIPLGWYDCGDGLYNPSNHIVYTYDNKFLRNADLDEHDWIIKHCRKGVTSSDQLGPNGLYQ